LPTVKRWDLLNRLIQARGYRSYLEIGCDRDATFRRISVREKVGVDPARGGTWRGTSDEFFARNARRFDLIFVDGDHHAEQAWRDVCHALEAREPGGCVVCHDALPRSERQTRGKGDWRGNWTGEVWKAIAGLRALPTIDTAVGDFDFGCAVILDRPNGAPPASTVPWRELSWDDYRARRDDLLRVMSWEDLKTWLE